jgi:methionine aminopeptidase
VLTFSPALPIMYLQDDEGIELCEVTKESLEAGIKVCGPGVPLSEIARAIE